MRVKVMVVVVMKMMTMVMMKDMMMVVVVTIMQVIIMTIKPSNFSVPHRHAAALPQAPCC